MTFLLYFLYLWSGLGRKLSFISSKLATAHALIDFAEIQEQKASHIVRLIVNLEQQKPQEVDIYSYKKQQISQ